MQSIEELEKKFASPGVSFQDVNGIGIITLETPVFSAKIALQGAHLMTWKPEGEKYPVVWVSEEAKVLPGKSIRGGIPVCWPWFGPHEKEGFPAHGFARTVVWELVSVTVLDGNADVVLRLPQSAIPREQWPHACDLELQFSLGSKLEASLVTKNTGSKEFVISEALHTYFQIGEIEKIRISGLDNTAYLDKVNGQNLREQTGDVECRSEVDRVYMNTAAECIIHDETLGRNIHVQKAHSLSTVVWTPWQEKADKMGDLGGNNGWRKMVCVESGNIGENSVTIMPGKHHQLTIVYFVK